MTIKPHISGAYPRVSVLTPTWNRGPYLERVWSGLAAQSFRSFEWIVANDGSEDDTIEIVRQLARKSNFAVTLINASERIGKSRMDNELVRAARGEFAIWCDSDDVLYSNALSTLMETWESIPQVNRDAFMGLTALCDTEDRVLGQVIPTGGKDLPFNEFLWNLKSDLVIFSRTSLLKEVPFLEVDFLIPETSVWCVIGKRKIRFIKQVLERKNYRAPNALSFTGKMAYNRGRAYALGLSNSHIPEKIDLFERFRRSTNFIRYCIHGDVAPITALRIWKGDGLSYLLLIAVAPVGLLLALNDKRRGIVQKTHKDFESAKARVTITVERLVPAS